MSDDIKIRVDLKVELVHVATPQNVDEEVKRRIQQAKVDQLARNMEKAIQMWFESQSKYWENLDIIPTNQDLTDQ